MTKKSPHTPKSERFVTARVYRAFGERTLIEKDSTVGYDLECTMFDRWWLTWFWTHKLLESVGYKEAALSLFFMAAMVEAGDA